MANSHDASRLAIDLAVNGAERAITIDVRTTLLDLLREGLHLSGVKKGCDHGTSGRARF
jgi:xanthine dehydrogenase YagT iron-sulfur-binding subunit